MDTLLANRLSAVKPSPSMAAKARVDALRAAGRNIIDFTIGEPDFATPPQIHSAPDCIAIQAPIITSMVVSISAPRSGRSSVISMAAPSSQPARMAMGSARKKFTPS